MEDDQVFDNSRDTLTGAATQSVIDWEMMLGPCDATTESTSIRPSDCRRKST